MSEARYRLTAAPGLYVGPVTGQERRRMVLRSDAVDFSKEEAEEIRKSAGIDLDLEPSWAAHGTDPRGGA